MKIFSIKDDKSQTYQGAYTFANDAIAVREFDSAFQNGKLGLMQQYPADFALFQIADFDENTGVVSPNLRLVKNFADFEVSNNGQQRS